MSRAADAAPLLPLRLPLLPRLTFVLGLVAALGALPSPARAYEDQLTLELGVGYAHAFAGDSIPASGLPLLITGSIGLDDVWTLRASVGYALHPGDPTMHVGLFGAELLYVVDIFEIVPYFGVGLDGLTTLSEGRVGADFAAHIVLGADYLLSRTAYVGLDIRPYLVVSELFEANRRFPAYLTVIARVGLVFDL